jgi:signal transduction histidine kinase
MLQTCINHVEIEDHTIKSKSINGAGSETSGTTGKQEASEITEVLQAVEAMPDRRVEEYSDGANFTWVTSALTERRDEILERWLEAAISQTFHAGRREHAVADHIPRLFDALVDLLNATAPSWVDARAPLEDSGIMAATQGHARARAAQGLSPANVVVEFRLLRQEIWRALRAELPNRAPTGDVVAAEMLVNDALDSAITQALAALSDYVEQVREEFLATTLHDVRQPLTSISGEAQLLVRRLSRATPRDPQQLLDGAERIQASAKRMTSLLEMLSDVSRLALGGLEMHISEANLEDVVRTALAHCPADDVARTVVTSEPTSELKGDWDPNRLEQVVSNLLGNAFKYSDKDTPIEVTLSAANSPDTVALTVRDHGIGIPAEDIPHIFARYKRAGNAVGNGIDGLGLGLFLCKGIVEAHGGHIFAESEGPGHGTAITIVLPRHTTQ